MQSPDEWMTSTLLFQVADALGGMIAPLDVKLVVRSNHLPVTADTHVITDQLSVEVEDKRDLSSDKQPGDA